MPGEHRPGCGVKAFRDPALSWDFDTPELTLDVTRDHRYAVSWTPGGVEVFVDDDPIRRTSQSPDYPTQIILGVFDFPDRATEEERAGLVPPPTPELVVSRVAWTPPG